MLVVGRCVYRRLHLDHAGTVLTDLAANNWGFRDSNSRAIEFELARRSHKILWAPPVCRTDPMLSLPHRPQHPPPQKRLMRYSSS
jgi:hypothetical protein